MELAQRIDLFSALGRRIVSMSSSEMTQLCARVYNENNWFTAENISLAFQGIARFLQKESLSEWVSHYNFKNVKPKKVGVVMTGNIPLVGFHDILSIVISGHILAVKTSSSDDVLIRWIINELSELEPGIKTKIGFADRLNDVDAIIATGSNNSARYFEYYFSKIPHIIRKNRSSCAVLTGCESDDQLNALGNDIFSYYGLGCRNVSKIFTPQGYELPNLLNHFESFKGVIDHHKYNNNYDYNKSIYLVNKEPHLDTGFLLVRQTTEIVSPISVLFYEHYDSQQALGQMLELQKDNIQCVVGNGSICNVDFGQTQCPGLDEYADGVDTVKFLTELDN
ncbi:MAG: acyl-CoA reductase [Bacteroidetes bacterium]|nr:acyl-CoA reductase [Bacteroidota bacterium]MDA1121675.1 acyl-CoA reductase [Bacteroidota bacterium]